jgi:hypothetical protein
MGIHLIHYADDNKHTKTHDVVRDTFATIVHDVNFHVGQKQLHVFFSNISIPPIDESTLCSPKMAFAP